MALAESRQVIETNIQLATSGAMERGGIVSFVSWAEGLGYYAPSGDMSGTTGQVKTRPAGLLMEDIEDINPVKQPQYNQRAVSPIGSVIGVATQGEFKTNFVETTYIPAGGVGVLTLTYKPGDPLYVADLGYISNLNTGGASPRPQIGYALSSVDSDGYLKFRLEIH